MELLSVFDDEFLEYGSIVTGIDEAVAEILNVLKDTPVPEGTKYVAEDQGLQALPAMQIVRDHCFGGMPVQLGWCNGHNTKLNCLEYHRDSEFNLGTGDFILLLARRSEIKEGILDTSKVKAFKVPAGVLVEVFATTLHYAPCHVDSKKGFQVLVALPQGTNTEKPEITPVTPEDEIMTARNKWLLPHPDSKEAARGLKIGLAGKNIDITEEILI